MHVRRSGYGKTRVRPAARRLPFLFGVLVAATLLGVGGSAAGVLAASGSDSKAPTAALSAPATDAALPAPVKVSGTASDDRGVASVKVAYQDLLTKLWWHTDGTWGSFAWIDATLASPGAASTAWSHTWANTRPGAYGVLVQAWDTAGKASNRPWGRFAVTDTTPPTAPAVTLRTAQTPASAALTWAASTDNVGVANYVVRRNGADVATVTSPGFTDTGLAYDVDYTFEVVAADAAGNKATSNQVQARIARPDTVAPDTAIVAPAQGGTVTSGKGLAVSGTANDDHSVSQVSVSVQNASGVWVRPDGSVSLLPDVEAASLSSSGPSVTWSYSFKPSAPGSYTIKATATDSSGNADTTAAVRSILAADTTAPSAPTNLSGSETSPSNVALSWNASSDDVGVASYSVTRNGTVIGSTSATTLKDTAAPSGASVAYAVTAADAAGNTAVSDTVLVATSAPSTGLAFEPSGLSGAGFQNVIAADPFGSGLVLSGADVAGVHRSTDFGGHWTTSNGGFTTTSHLRIADLAFSPTVPNRVYAATGYLGSGGGVFASDDGGVNWSLRSNVPQFNGGNNGGISGLPTTDHPRSTGDLLVVDDANHLIYAATFEHGVMRSADDGRTWTTLGLDGKYLRALAADPSNPDILYAATYGNGIYKTTAARSGGSFSVLAGSPANAEDILVIGGKVWVAGGPAGVFSSSNGGASWTQAASTVLRSDGPTWYSLAGYMPSGGSAVLYAGNVDPTRQPNVTPYIFQSIFRSTDGGATWTPVTVDRNKISTKMGGTGETWWLAQYQSWMMLGGGSYVASDMEVDRADPRRIWVAGRSGAWLSKDSGDSWYPVVDGMGVTINRSVAADPNVPGRVYVANTDWVMLYSSDSMAHVAQSKPPVGNMAYSIALDTTTTPSRVYLATGERDTNTQGDVYSNPDPASGGAWVDEGLSDFTGAKRVFAVAVNRVGGQPVIVAAVEGSGIWRKAGGTWTRVNSTALTTTQNTKTASITWAPGSPDVYLYDHMSGVWRSTDDGATWTKIWGQTLNVWETGFVAADPKNNQRLYVSNTQGLFRLDNAVSGASVESGAITKTSLGVASAGAVSVGSDARLLVATRVSATVAAALLTSTDNGASWTKVSDDHWRTAAGHTFSLAQGPGGMVYAALNGNGVVVGSPTGAGGQPLEVFYDAN